MGVAKQKSEEKSLSLKLMAQENFKAVFVHLKAEERRLSKMLSSLLV